MIDASRQKLLLLGMPASQIQKVIQRGKPDLTVPVFSNYSGHIQQAGWSEAWGHHHNLHPQWLQITLTAELPLKRGNVSSKRTEYFQCLQSQQNLGPDQYFLEDIALVSKGQSVMIIPEANPENRFKGIIGFIEQSFSGRARKTLNGARLF